ncbi:MAG: biotin/lipoyl-binding protein [Gammaproteobacteria bacterium]|nr:biotin/lipoyl-binding protein [Gammaproteobacteria bacterium]
MRARAAAKFLLPLLLVGVAVTGFGYFKSTKPNQPKPRHSERSWMVETIAAQPGQFAPSLTLYGKVEAPTLLQPAAPGAGIVSEVRVRDGQRVRKDDILLILDPRDFAPAVDQARADVLDLEAQVAELELRSRSDRQALVEEKRMLVLAQNTVKRARQLQKQKLGSESNLEDAQQALGRQQLALTTRQLDVDSHAARAKQLAARLQSNRARLAQAELALQRSRVSATFDGIVSDVNVAAGDRVQASQALLSLFPMDDLEIRARLPGRYQGEIQNALSDGQTLQAHVELPGSSISLSLRRLAAEGDPSGIDAFFSVDSAAHPLRPGNLVELVLSRPPQKRVLAVPFQAIYGNNRLFLLREGRMHGVAVEALGSYTAEDGSEALLIRSDVIDIGAQIIVTHLPNAVDGLKVKNVNSKDEPRGNKQRAPAAS